MTALDALGCAMAAATFILLFVLCGRDVGFKFATVLFGGGTALILWLGLAAKLLSK